MALLQGTASLEKLQATLNRSLQQTILMGHLPQHDRFVGIHLSNKGPASLQVECGVAAGPALNVHPLPSLVLSSLAHSFNPSFLPSILPSFNPSFLSFPISCLLYLLFLVLFFSLSLSISRALLFSLSLSFSPSLSPSWQCAMLGSQSTCRPSEPLLLLYLSAHC